MKANNTAKLREVVRELLDTMYDMGIDEETVAISIESPNCHMNQHRVAQVIKKAKAVLAEPPEPIGNGAKTREVLKRASERLRKATESETFGEDVQYLVGCMRSVAQECDDALAEPPRNCDCNPTFAEAARAFVTELAGADVGVGDLVRDVVGNWLYAVAEGGAS